MPRLAALGYCGVSGKTNMQDLEVGDIVRVIPINLEAISKSFLNYEENLKNCAGASDPCIMLGGQYKILDIEGCYCRLIDNNENNIGVVNVKHLVSATQAKDCIFNIKDRVEHIQSGRKFEIKRIINGYFLLFEGNEVFPFNSVQNWTDYKSI